MTTGRASPTPPTRVVFGPCRGEKARRDNLQAVCRWTHVRSKHVSANRGLRMHEKIVAIPLISRLMTPITNIASLRFGWLPVVGKIKGPKSRRNVVMLRRIVGLLEIQKHLGNYWDTPISWKWLIQGGLNKIEILEFRTSRNIWVPQLFGIFICPTLEHNMRRKTHIEQGR